eukprot:CAMPEP_0196732648 /NCGR_PEP_ID=MMETSP1091-20130531/11996_1 /TAXON_ID=302021 /ORGANISM="Rhodomonas sp., Strain CCMP768" /LENGTH=166 /DNA_ID=CAMNT_0042075947 /DNA_START=98 /DNA_END=594 /DNA_ORIENTATION=+
MAQSPVTPSLRQTATVTRTVTLRPLARRVTLLPFKFKLGPTSASSSTSVHCTRRPAPAACAEPLYLITAAPVSPGPVTRSQALPVLPGLLLRVSRTWAGSRPKAAMAGGRRAAPQPSSKAARMSCARGKGRAGRVEGAARELQLRQTQEAQGTAEEAARLDAHWHA